MDRITPLGRAIMDILDVSDIAPTAAEIYAWWPTLSTRPTYIDFVLELQALHDAELVESIDRAFMLSATGCDALWALMRADTKCVVKHWAEEPHKEHLLPHPVHFESRAAMREYLRGAA